MGGGGNGGPGGGGGEGGCERLSLTLPCHYGNDPAPVCERSVPYVIVWFIWGARLQDGVHG